MKKRLLCLWLVIAIVAGLVAAVPVSAVSQMVTSDSGLDLIKQFEGFSATPYRDTDGLYTIGYGTRCPTDKVDYYRENPMTPEEAEAELRKAVVTYEKAVNAFIDRHGLSFSQQQFDAVVSLVYNVGPSWLTKGGTLINALTGGATGNDLIYAFTIYSLSGGNRSVGHVKRRLSEANVYLNGVYSRTLPDNYAYVIYDPQGGTVSSYNVQGYDADLTAVPKVSASRDGYDFKGWFTATEGGKKVELLDGTTKNMTLYAQWESLSGEMPDDPVQGGDPAPEKLVVTVTGSNVNVRKGPGLSYGIVRKIGAGTKLTITEIRENDGYVWGQFEEGWIALEYTDYTPEQSCTHRYSVTVRSDPTCTDDGSAIYTCSDCGDSYTETLAATGHSYASATCTAAKKCKTCGTTSGEPLGHSYGTDGICTRCGHNKGITVTVTSDSVLFRSGPGTNYQVVGTVYRGDKLDITQTKQVGDYLWGKFAKGWISLRRTNYAAVTCKHDYSVTSKTPTTCTTKGTVTYTCELCGDSYSETAPARGHEYGVNGRCIYCKAMDPDFRGMVVTVTGNNVNIRKGAGLSYSTVGSVSAGEKLTITETKNNDGYHWGKCSKGWIALKYTNYDQLVVASCDHAYGITNQKAPTCTAAGSVTYICDYCGDSYTESVPGKGHLFRNATCTEAKTCDVCGAVSGSPLGHMYGTNGLCVRCGDLNPEYEAANWATIVKLYATVANTDSLNIRRTPNGTLVGSLDRGDKVEILEQQTVNSLQWGRCANGWICLSKYCELTTATEKIEKNQLTGLTGVVTANSLVVRAGAGTKYDIVDRLPKGTTIVILEKVAGTSSVWGRTNLGWVSMKYVEWTEVGVTTANSLIVREGPGASYAQVNRLPKGTAVVILEQKSANGVIWGRTEYGWISIRYVQMGEAGTVTASALIVRAGAGTNYAQVDRLPRGTMVVILETKLNGTTSWGRTQYGWVSLKYVDCNG